MQSASAGIIFQGPLHSLLSNPECVVCDTSAVSHVTLVKASLPDDVLYYGLRCDCIKEPLLGPQHYLVTVVNSWWCFSLLNDKVFKFFLHGCVNRFIAEV